MPYSTLFFIGFFWISTLLTGTTPEPETVVNDENFQSDSNQIVFPENWSWKSFSVLPEGGIDAVNLFSPIFENLIVVMGRSGALLNSPWGWLDEIGEMDSSYGYLIKIASEDSLAIEGVRIDPLEPLPLDSAWNWVGFYGEAPLNVLSAFNEILDYVVVVRAQYGALQNTPWGWMNGIGNVIVNEGYIIKVTDDISFTWPTFRRLQRIDESEHFSQINVTATNHFQYVQTGLYELILLGEHNNLFTAGEDEIGVFCDLVGLGNPEDMVCVGAVVFNGLPGQQILVWEDDSYTNDVDGFVLGYPIIFRYYDSSTDQEYPLNVDFIEFPHWDSTGFFGNGLISGVELAPVFYSGPVWHISTTGSDSTGDGSEMNPFATIQHGIDAANEGDTVLVSPGAYIERINFSGKNIAVGSFFILEGDTSYISQTIIDGSDELPGGSVVTFENGETNEAKLAGFTIANGNGTFIEDYLHVGGGILCVNNSNPTLQNLDIKNNIINSPMTLVGGGIYCRNAHPTISKTIIRDNTISGVWGSFGGGIALDSSNAELSDVLIDNNSCTGVGGGLYIRGLSNVIMNNVIISNNQSGDGGGIGARDESIVNLISSILTGNDATWGESGSISVNDNSRMTIINSIVWNNSPSPPSAPENQFFTLYSNLEGGFIGEGNIDADPLFVDPENGDYYLQEDSPCIDAGTSFFVWEGDTLVNMSPDEYQGPAPDMGAFESEYSDSLMTLIFPHIPGWELVGLPLEVEDNYYTSVFPCALEMLPWPGPDPPPWWPDSLEIGQGYWLRFEEVCTDTITGLPIYELIIPVISGWNLISGISFPVSVNAIIDPDGLIVPGTVYSYNGTYFNTLSIEPGKGYWLNARNDGEITISSTALAKTSHFVNHLDGANTITFNGQTLYFDVSIPHEEKLSFSLPPKPPQGAFDARFTGGWKYCADYGVIEIMNPGESLAISYDVSDESEWLLSERSGDPDSESANRRRNVSGVSSKTGEEYALRGTGEIKLYGNVEKLALKKMDSPAIPGAFALHPAYPNPFNPVTTICYKVPEKSHIKISIFNVLGQELVQLKNREMEPGFHSVKWKAENASSGVYIVKMTVGRSTFSEKIMLLK